MKSQAAATTKSAAPSNMVIEKTSVYERPVSQPQPPQPPPPQQATGTPNVATAQPVQNPGPVAGPTTTKGIVLLQISRDMVYDPRKIDFASLSLPNTNKSSIKQK